MDKDLLVPIRGEDSDLVSALQLMPDGFFPMIPMSDQSEQLYRAYFDEQAMVVISLPLGLNPQELLANLPKAARIIDSTNNVFLYQGQVFQITS